MIVYLHVFIFINTAYSFIATQLIPGFSIEKSFLLLFRSSFEGTSKVPIKTKLFVSTCNLIVLWLHLFSAFQTYKSKQLN